MTKLRGNKHSTEHCEFLLRDDSSTGDHIIRTRDITRHWARRGQSNCPFIIAMDIITVQEVI